MCEAATSSASNDRWEMRDVRQDAGIMPIAKGLKRGSIIIRFMLQSQQNDEPSAERAGIED